jgi:outer membrane usher protein
LLCGPWASASQSLSHDIGQVTVPSGANVRAGNTFNAKILGTLLPRDTFAVSKKDDWYVILDGPYIGGYIRQEFVKLTGDKYALSKSVTDSVLVRAAPTKNGAIRGNLVSGEVFASEKKNDWVEIKDGRHKGRFVAAGFVKDLDSIAPEIKASPTPEIPTGSAQAITVESQATPTPTPSPTLTPTPTPEPTATPAATATPTPEPVAATTPAEVIPAPTAVPVPVATATNYLKGVVIAKTAVNIRKSPSVKSATNGVASPGVFLDMEPAGKGWYQVKSGLNEGNYIAAQFVKIVPANQVPVAATTTTTATAATPAATPTAAPAAAAPKTAGAPGLPAANPQWDSKTEQRFQDQIEKAFKKKAKAAPENEVIMPVFFENRSMALGQVDSRLRQGEPLIVDAPAFFKILRLLLPQPWFDRPEIAAINPEAVKNPQEFAAKRWVGINKFENTGIKVTYDPQRLDVIISVPPELRAPSVASILKGLAPSDDTAFTEPPSGFSTYLNIFASDTIDTRYKEFADRRMPLRAQLENGTNIGGVVIEAYGRYLEDRTGTSPDSTGLARGDIRAVKDFPSKTLRTSVGDLVYPTLGFQTFRQMAGVSFTSNFSMARSKLTYPTGNYEIFLQRNSKVYIWVNDQLQQVLDLPAGRHSLRDFPFVNGANDLRLEIIDDVGREETQRYAYFSSTELLRPELHQFNYAFGAPGTDVGNNRIYNSTNTTYSAFHRYGLLEDLTIGVNAQGDAKQTIAGLEALWSTSMGFVKLEPAISILNGETAGAIRGSYSYSDYKGAMKTQRTYRFDIMHAGAAFTPLSNSADSLPSPSVTKRTLEITGGYTQGISKNLSANTSGSMRFYDTVTGRQESFLLSLGANRKFDNGLSLSGTISHNKAQTGTEELNMFVFFLWSFPKEKQIVTAIHNSTDESSRFDWSYNPSTGADSSNYGATIRDSEKERGYSAQVLSDGNRTRSSISHEVIFSKVVDPTAVGDDATKKPTYHVTTMSLATSLAFAGGHFAIGRPVTDSFAIIAPVKNLRGQRLDINPMSDEAYTVKSDGLGAALLPELGSYNFTDISISGRKLPPQLSLPKDHFSVYPVYKSGYVFEIGTDATVYVTAKVFGPDGSPLSLAAGRAVYLTDSSQEPVTLFTNKRGTLNSEGFKPGRYRLELASDTFEPIEVTIPEDVKDNNFDLGNLKVKAK